MKYKKTKRILLILIFFVIIYGLCSAYVYFSNQSKIKTLVTEANWIEYYYTQNGYFPDNATFATQFPHPNVNQTYESHGISQKLYPNDNPSQRFELKYRLTTPWQKSYALGWAETTEFGFDGNYNIDPCPRWKSVGFNSFPEYNGYVYPPGGGLQPNFNLGTVLYMPQNSNVVTQTVLTGLSKPRLLQNGDATKIYVTDGDEIFSYNYSFANSKVVLSYRQEYKPIPTECPANYLYRMKSPETVSMSQ